MKGSPLKTGADYSQPLRASRIAIWTSITQNESLSDMCAHNPSIKSVEHEQEQLLRECNISEYITTFRAGMALRH